MKKTVSCNLLSIAASAVVCILPKSAVAQPTGTAIMTKTGAVYAHAHTLSQDWAATIGLGKLHMSMKILMQQEGIKSHIDMNTKMNMPGKAGAHNPFAHGISTVMVCNGKDIAIYLPMNNTYTVRPIPTSGPERQAMLSQTAGMVPNMTHLDGKFSFIKSGMVGKTPVWEVSYQANKGPKLPMVFYIDRSNYHVKQLTMDVTTPMGASQVVMTLLGEKINPHFPASLFVFVPPKGAHKSETPMMGMPGMGGPG